MMPQELNKNKILHYLTLTDMSYEWLPDENAEGRFKRRVKT